MDTLPIDQAKWARDIYKNISYKVSHPQTPGIVNLIAHGRDTIQATYEDVIKTFRIKEGAGYAWKKAILPSSITQGLKPEEVTIICASSTPKTALKEVGSPYATLVKDWRKVGKVVIAKKIKLGDDFIYEYAIYLHTNYLRPDEKDVEPQERLVDMTSNPKAWLRERALDELRLDLL